MQVFVVCEGNAFSIEDSPGWLNQDNWMCDWIFVGAFSGLEAVAVAAAVDKASASRHGRIYTKVLAIQEKRQKLLSKEVMPPASIYATQGGGMNSENLQFNQGWVKI
ncbi:hypothetical protein [Chroococcidiopsis sp.]|uniref:hypothetical protein n=1 Tax=Chroococcidiopsis sp. TaxID=3088168 RepID=UPI003F3445D9